MVKGWNRNRGWNNGWGANRTSSNGNRDLKWVSHSTIEIGRRGLSGPIARPSEATRASEAAGIEGKVMEPIPVLRELASPETASQLHRTGIELNLNC